MGTQALNFEQAATSFLNHLQIERGLASNSIAAYRRDLRKFADFLNGSPLSGVDPEIINKFESSLREAKLSVASINRIDSTLRSFFKHLQQEYGYSDPTLEIAPKKSARRLPKALTINQIVSMIGAAHREGQPITLRDQAMLELLYSSGARVSELIGINGKQLITYNNESIGLNGTTENLHIRSIMEDSKGNLWIGNNCGGGRSGIGVIKYDGKNFTQFTKQHRLRTEDTKGNSLDKVFSMCEDSSGNIWFGTNESGVWRYDGQSLKNFTKEDGLDSGMTWIIYKSKSGELWYGGGPNGVYRFTGKSFERIY